MKAKMNRPGPHRRDYERLERVASACGLGWGESHAATGTVYVTVAEIGVDPDDDECCEATGYERVYRFASHPEAHTSHDYSVASGSTLPPAGSSLPPGFDGWVENAITDMIEYFEVENHPAARRALATIHAVQRRRAQQQAEFQRQREEWAAKQRAAAERAEAERKLTTPFIHGVLRLAEDLWPDWCTKRSIHERFDRALQWAEVPRTDAVHEQLRIIARELKRA